MLISSQSVITCRHDSCMHAGPTATASLLASWYACTQSLLGGGSDHLESFLTYYDSMSTSSSLSFLVLNKTRQDKAEILL